jgi:hypothetical protein
MRGWPDLSQRQESAVLLREAGNRRKDDDTFGMAAGAGLVMLMTGALAVHYRAGDPLPRMVPAIVLGARWRSFTLYSWFRRFTGHGERGRSRSGVISDELA